MASGTRLGPHQSKAYIYWTWTVSDPAPGATSVSVAITGDLRMDSQSSIAGNWNTNWWGGLGSGSAVRTLNLNAGQQGELISWSTTVNISDSTSTLSVAVGVNQYHGRTEDTLSVPIPKRVYSQPAAPSTPTVTRVSDSFHTVNWNRVASTAAPYTSQQLQRAQAVAGGGWSSWAGISAINTRYTNNGSHSVTDNGTAANRKYKNRVKAANTVGERYSAESAVYYTTPATPTVLTAEKLSDTSIKLTFNTAVPYSEYRSYLQYSLNGGSTWSVLATVSSGVTEYTWNTVPSGSSVIFRISTGVYDSGKIGHDLRSGYKLSNEVPLLAPPLAPTVVSPNGIALKSNTPIIFRWKHNSADSSSQQSFEVFRKYGTGATPWSSFGRVYSSQDYFIIPEGEVSRSDYLWQVRTWGAHPNPSPRSAVANITISDPPIATITAPGAVVTQSRVSISWTYSDTETPSQAAWEAELIGDSGVLEVRSGTGTQSSLTFNTRLENFSNYQAAVRVMDGVNIWSDWDQHSFSTDFDQPLEPTLTVFFDEESGSVQLDVDNPVDPLTLSHNEILRSNDGGNTWETAATIPINGTGFDNAVTIGLDSVLYKAVAWTSLPSSKESVAQSVATFSDRGYWSVGTDFELMIPLKINIKKPPKIDLTTDLHSKTLHYFAGRTLPTETAGDALAVSGSVEFAVNSVEQLTQVRQMAKLPAPHLFRLPDGTFLYASIKGVRDSRLEVGWYSIRLRITEVGKDPVVSYAMGQPIQPPGTPGLPSPIF